MRIRNVCVLVAVMFSLACLNSCSGREEAADTSPAPTAEDVKKETQEALSTAGDFAKAKKQEYVKKIEVKLDNLERGIELLRDRLREGRGAPLPDAVQKRIDDASKKVKQLREKAAELRAASPEAFDDMKQRTEDAIGRLKETIGDLAKQVKR